MITEQINFKIQKCIPAINSIHGDKFSERPDINWHEKSSTKHFYTSFCQYPERLAISTDFSRLLATLCREVCEEENYAKALKVCKMMKESAPGNQMVDKIFEYLLMQILKEERTPKPDVHIILDWLDTGERKFSCDMMTKQSYALLKLYFLFRNRQSKLECFPCGCLQQYFIEIYKESTRFMTTLKSLMTWNLPSLHHIVKRLFTAMPVISPSDYFEYYIELLGELQTCHVIENTTTEKQISRLVQLIGLLSGLELIEVPKACSQLNNYLEFGGEKKKSTMIESAIRTRLLPKILDSICIDFPSVRLDLSRGLVQKMVELVKDERYSNAEKAGVLFAPLKLLNRIHSEFDVWEKTSSIIKNRLTSSIKMESPQSAIVVLYFLSFAYRNDSSLLENLVNHMENEYKEASEIGVKMRILILLEIMEGLGDSNSYFQTYFKENQPRKQLLLGAEMEINLEYLQDFSPNELRDYFQQNTFSDEQFVILIEKLSDLDIPINSDSFWKCLLNRIDENSMIFIEKQLKILVNRGDREILRLRIDQIFKTIKSIELMEKSADLKEKSMELLLLNFPKILLEYSNSEYNMFPMNTSASLFAVLVLAFCTCNEGNEFKITLLFRRVNAKINKMPFDSTILDHSLEIIEETCQKIHSKEITDQLDPSFLSKLLETKPENVKKKERIIEVLSILFENLAPELQKLGDKHGKSSFCQICMLFNDYVKQASESEGIIPNFELFEKVCERAVGGFVQWTDEWNHLFVAPRIIMILTCAKKEMGLFRRLMRTLNKNQELITRLQSKKDFMELQKLLD